MKTCPIFPFFRKLTIMCSMQFNQSITDTSPTVEAVQIGLLREAGQVRRSRLMLSLTQSVFDLSRHNLRQKHLGLSEVELNLKFVELLYGEPLANSLRAYLISNKNE